MVSPATTANPPTFTWTSVTGANYYYVIVIDQTTNLVAAYNPKVTGNSWQPTAALTHGHTYAWYVGAISTNGLAAARTAGPAFQIM